MAQFTLAIEMDNAAFEGCKGDEVARILRVLADRVEGNDFQHEDTGRVRDGLGNTVGQWTACLDEDETETGREGE